ncbi:hypothetical protein [Nonomuraea maritima]|uniref:hypothetical protein n=1 Tax=Nonomuraea maritima TaxID=683260 RepID=UPI00371311E7
MTNQTSGGFTGDLAEAFTTPAAGGCCGAPAATASSEAAQEAGQSGCCGQDPAPAAQITDATSTGCCG